MTRRALVVDADSALLDVTAHALSLQGFDVARASTLEDARARLDEGRFDATLLDIELGDGAAALPAPSRGALIAVGSLPEAATVQRWFELGAAGFIARPFEPRQLGDRVAELIERAARGAPPLAHVPGPRRPDGPSLRALSRESSLRGLLEAAAALLDAPIVLVTELSGDQQLLRVRVGLDAERTRRDEALCAYTVARASTFVVEDAALDARFRDNPLVTGPPGVRFYAGVPITVEGAPAGALCVLDRRARTLTARDEQFLGALARHIGDLVGAAAAGARAEQLLEAAPGWIHSVDGDGLIRFANAAWRAALGYATPVGMPIDRVLAPDDAAARARVHERVLEARERGAPVTARFRVVTADGSIIAVRGSTRWLSEDRAITVLERTDARTATELELGAVAEALRAPLAALRGALGLLGGALDGELRELARRADEDGRRADEVLDDLSTLEAAAAGTLALTRELTSLAELLRGALGASTPELPSVHVDVDAPRLCRALRDLARDVAAPPGDVVAAVERGRCVIVLRGPGAAPTPADRVATARSLAVLSLHGCDVTRSDDHGVVAWTVAIPRARPSLAESSPRMRLLADALGELRRGLLDGAPAQVALARASGRVADARPALARLAATAGTAGLEELAAAATRAVATLDEGGGTLAQALDDVEAAVAAAR